MKLIEVRNVNGALSRGITHLLNEGTREESRNGPVLVALDPVVTTYIAPTERVVFSKTRDANPFFHLMEALWMLVGRNDLGWPAFFNKRFEGFSDDGLTVHGAYGHRWRKAFGIDQIPIIINELKKNPTSRRCVLAMWDARSSVEDGTAMNDLQKAMTGGKDVPCNTHIYFDVRESQLNMTVCNRSNDIIWGAYGANAVHFSILQEYMAGMIGVPVGVYRQFSNNFHAYLDIYDEDKLRRIAQESDQDNHYEDYHEGIKPYPLMTDPSCWDDDLKLFMSSPGVIREYYNPFFFEVAFPMYMTWVERKQKHSDGRMYQQRIKADDWRIAADIWITKRDERK